MEPVGYVVRYSTTYKLHDIEQLIEQAVNEMTMNKWSGCVEQCGQHCRGQSYR